MLPPRWTRRARASLPVFVLVIVLVSATGCDLTRAVAGARCTKVGAYAQDGTFVLKCGSNRRWQRGITTATADAALRYLLSTLTPTTTSTTVTNTVAPTTTVPASLQAQSVSSGAYFNSCAVLLDDRVACWGLNDHGQLGSSTPPFSAVPLVVGIGPAQQVAVGDGHACALLLDGHVTCWGWNHLGELGDGTTTDSPTPVQVTGLSGITKISLANSGGCALSGSGVVSCWGRTGPTSSAIQLSATAVGGLGAAASDIAVGGGHVCAVLVGGSVSCWGNNGLVGDGSNVERTVPTAVSTLSGVSSVSAGQSSTCVVRAVGTVACWGDDTYGQIGNYSIGATVLSPVDVPDLTSIAHVSVGDRDACVLASNGALTCWGEWEWVSPGTTQPYAHLSVPGLPSASQIDAGVRTSCAVRSDHHVLCWGDGSYGALGRTVSNSGGRFELGEVVAG